MTEEERAEQLRDIDEKMLAKAAGERQAKEHFYGSYRDLPFTVEPQGLWLQVAPIDADAHGLIAKKGMIALPEKQRLLDVFEVLAAGSGYPSPYSADTRVNNPYKKGDLIIVEQTHVQITVYGDKRLAMVGADKVVGKVKAMTKGDM